MASGADTQTDTHIHTHTRIPTRGPKQFQETRRARPSAARAWFNNHTLLALLLTLRQFVLKFDTMDEYNTE